MGKGVVSRWGCWVGLPSWMGTTAGRARSSFWYRESMKRTSRRDASTVKKLPD